jgi:predicted ATP-grasp superfamily ATP-dependent carboligase
MKLRENIGVIVIGGHIQGLGIIRIFGEEGIPSVLIDDTSINIARYSKYCEKFLLCEKSHLFDYLIKIGEKGIYKDWLLIPTNDYHVRILSENREVLMRFFKVSTDNWASTSLCYNKINTYKLAFNLGLVIPTTLYPQSHNDLSKINIKYPCIIKPAVMHNFYSVHKKKVFVCNSFDELVFYYNEAIKTIPRDEVMIQEIIKGSSEHQYSACILILDGEIQTAFTARRKRQHPIEFGNATTFAETVHIPEIIEYSTLLLKSIKYNGICEVEFKFDQTDFKYKFLEINPRSWKWHLITKKIGVNPLLNLYKYFYGLPLNINEIKNDNVGWRHIVTDLPTVFVLLMKGLLKKSKSCEIQDAVWSWKDIAPGFMELLFLPILIFKR